MKELVILFGFMTLPIWIPVIGTTIGHLTDIVKLRRGHVPAAPVVEQLKARRAAEAQRPATIEVAAQAA